MQDEQPKARGRPKGSSSKQASEKKTDERQVIGSRVAYESAALVAHTVQATSFKSLIEALRDVLSDVNITFDSSGMRLCSMDSSQSALVFASLDSTKFEEYHVAGDRVVVGLNISSFYRLLKTAGNHDVLTLYVMHDDVHSLCVKLTNTEKNCHVVSRLRLLDLDYETYSVPAIDFDSVFVMPSAELQKYIRDLKDISEHITISCQGGDLRFTVQGDFASQEWTLGSRKQGGVAFTKEHEGVSCKFKMKYLVLFTKSAVACPIAELFLKQGFPMVLRYSIGTLGRLQYAISPDE